MDRNIITWGDAERIRVEAYRQSHSGMPNDETRLPSLGTGLDTEARPDAWFGRLAKYIPAEAVGLYFALAGVLSDVKTLEAHAGALLTLVLVICLVFNTLYLRLLWKVRRLFQIVTSDVTLLVYAYASGGELIKHIPLYEPKAATVALILTASFLVFVEPPAAQP